MIVNGFPVTGEPDDRFAAFDHAMTVCMSEHGIPGGSFTLMRHGDLLHTRGYGWADLQTRETVTTRSLFRIASVSKPITAVGIMKLVEVGKLGLDDRVFDILPYDPFPSSDSRPDPRTRNITLRHCLNHTGGWDRDLSGDAMFLSVRIAQALGVDAPASPEHIMRWLSGRALDFEPGTRYAYSNYGYCLLGRVIEKLTGRTYEEWICAEVLAPIGIQHMRIGKTHYSGRAENEVVYYPVTGFSPSVFQENLGQKVPNPYGAWYLEAMDSHGAWIASSTDIATFASAFHDKDHSPLLSRESIETMFSRPSGPVGLDTAGNPKQSYYALGWAVDLPGSNGEVGQQHHNGMLVGTATVMRRRDDGICWSALFNLSLGRREAYTGSAIVPLINQAIKGLEL
jgi:N-acyl-D-amino-acid deacylase